MMRPQLRLPRERDLRLLVSRLASEGLKVGTRAWQALAARAPRDRGVIVEPLTRPPVPPGFRRNPVDGLPAWNTPDASQLPVATLDADVAIRVIERVGAWARIRCPNGWTGWVDGDALARDDEGIVPR